MKNKKDVWLLLLAVKAQKYYYYQWKWDALQQLGALQMLWTITPMSPRLLQSKTSGGHQADVSALKHQPAFDSPVGKHPFKISCVPQSSKTGSERRNSTISHCPEHTNWPFLWLGTSHMPEISYSRFWNDTKEAIMFSFPPRAFFFLLFL